MHVYNVAYYDSFTFYTSSFGYLARPLELGSKQGLEVGKVLFYGSTGVGAFGMGEDFPGFRLHPGEYVRLLLADQLVVF
jgi:hypothetical protein